MTYILSFFSSLPQSFQGILFRGLLIGWMILYRGGGGRVVWLPPDFGKSADTCPPRRGCHLFWVGALLSCCFTRIPLCTCLLVANPGGGGATPRFWTPTTPPTNCWPEAPPGGGGGGIGGVLRAVHKVCTVPCPNCIVVPSINNNEPKVRSPSPPPSSSQPGRSLLALLEAKQ